MMASSTADEFTGRMFEAINGMLLDMLAAVARKDYTDRHRRQAQGQAKPKAEGRYKGRPEDTEREDCKAPDASCLVGCEPCPPHQKRYERNFSAEKAR
jgi:DNA invertase Pin-like site-specific DNA recombinase